MESASAPDDQTLVIHWSRVDTTADQATGFIPLARHLLADAYAGVKDAFMNSSRFRGDFVGLGPYRVTDWELGSHMDAARSDDYFGGRPPLDSVIGRFILDGNRMMANLLSGDDVVLRPQIDLSTAIDVQEQWTGLGNQAWPELNGRVHYGEAQRRVELAKPRNGFTNQQARQAFLMATDRQALSEAFTQGLSPLEDSYVAPDDPLRPQVEAAISTFTYDLTAAAAPSPQPSPARVEGVLASPLAGDGASRGNQQSKRHGVPVGQ